MKKTTVLGTLILAPILVLGQAPAGYYNGTEGITKFKLKSKLNKIISKNTVSWHYGNLPTHYETTDRDWYYENDGSIMDIYAEVPDGPDPYNYTYETPSLISGAGEEGLGWNREHILSQSFFYGKYPMYSDMHFVVPTDARVNQRRSNLPFGKVNASPNFVSLNGSKVGLSVSPGYTLSVFEPHDSFKGDVARMLMYAAVRYEELIPMFDTANTRNPFIGRGEKAFKEWQLNQLLEWHINDPVSEREISRNNEVFLIQGNRNPFIDHPEWATTIWDNFSDDVSPNAPYSIYTISKGKTFIHFQWEESMESDAIGYEVYVNDTLHTNTRTNSFTLVGLTPSSIHQIKVRTYDMKYNYSEYSPTLNETTLSTDTFSSDLFISKVIEGTDFNKAFEITNMTGYPVDLRNYSLGKREVNSYTGSLYWPDNALQLEGILQHGEKIVLVHPEWNLPCFSKDDATFITASPPLLFDGSLAVRLNNKNKTIDIIGSSINMDPFAENVSLYRKPTIKNPNNVFVNDEWEWKALNYCDGLGEIDTDSSTTLKNYEKNGLIKIYPNPVRVGDVLTIENPNINTINSIAIYNLLGVKVWEQQEKMSGTTMINIPQLSSGMYFIHIDESIHKLTIK